MHSLSASKLAQQTLSSTMGPLDCMIADDDETGGVEELVRLEQTGGVNRRVLHSLMLGEAFQRLRAGVSDAV